MNYFRRLHNWYTGPNNKLDLSSLPPDLQYEILSKNPELIRIGRQLNTNLRKRLDDDYVESVWRQPLTKKEIRDILMNIPLSFFVVSIATNNKELFYYYPSNIGAIIGKTVKIETIKRPYTISGYYQIHIDMIDLKERLNNLLSTDRYYVDVFTIFDILKNRYGQPDPEYAFRGMKKYFSQTIRELDTDDFSDFFALYQYLVGHLWIFGIPYNIPNIVLPYNTPHVGILTDTDILRMERDINKMIPVCTQILNDLRIDAKGALILPDNLSQYTI